MKSILLTTICGVTATLESVSPRLAHWWISWLFFSPRTSRRELPRIPGLQQRWLIYTKTNGARSKCRVYSAGTGPAVLLIHGWEGSTSSMTAIARVLLDKGLRVVLFDLPAHGLSPGRKTNLIEISRVIQQLASDEGHFCALVGHSFGAVCAGHAIKAGVSTDHFITISAPAKIDFIINFFCSMVGASTKTKSSLIRQIEVIFQAPYEEASLTELASVFDQNGLIIHDRKDRMVPYALAEEFSAVWADARLLTTNGLGHNRILRNEDVITAIVSEILPSLEGDFIELDRAVNR